MSSVTFSNILILYDYRRKRFVKILLQVNMVVIREKILGSYCSLNSQSQLELGVGEGLATHAS